MDRDRRQKIYDTVYPIICNGAATYDTAKAITSAIEEIVDDVVSDAFNRGVAEGRETEVCPYDCDNCHDDECPCDRLGCAGYKGR